MTETIAYEKDGEIHRIDAQYLSQLADESGDYKNVRFYENGNLIARADSAEELINRVEHIFYDDARRKYESRGILARLLL